MIDLNYKDITTLFLDVGNTLISIDFAWVSEKLTRLGISCDPAALQRTEAAARPALSAMVHENKNNPRFDGRAFYFANMIGKLPVEIIRDGHDIDQVARHLASDLHPEGNALLLWSHVMSGTHEALEKFQSLGLRMHVISNSDGTVEESLIRKDLRSFFGEVIDSHKVQVEKPDPRIFELALERTGCKPEDALYVGDIYHVDIVGAQSVGMQAILLDPYADWDAVPCPTISDLLALAHRFQDVRMGCRI
jgi:HAD superfamily hydrolase (TIGR01509 family)